MSVRKFRTSAADAGAPLGAWLAARLGVPEAEAVAAVVAGRVYVGRERARDPGRALAAAQTVAVHEAPATERAPWRIVHDAGGVLVVDKPAGLAVQATRDAAGALDEQVAARFPGATLAHRIDAATSGLVLFARTDGARARLAAALGDGTLAREYVAVVAGAPAADDFTLDAPIGPDPRDRRRQAAGVPGGRAARTHVRVERRDPAAGRAVLRCRLDTGRTHQIRVHLAHAGLPIVGDPLYAPPAVAAAAPRLMLHAARLAWPGGSAESPAPF